MKFLKRYLNNKKPIDMEESILQRLYEAFTTDLITQMANLPDYGEKLSGKFVIEDEQVVPLSELFRKARANMIDRTILLFEDMINGSFLKDDTVVSSFDADQLQDAMLLMKRCFVEMGFTEKDALNKVNDEKQSVLAALGEYYKPAMVENIGLPRGSSSSLTL